MKDKLCIRCWDEIALPQKTFCKKCDSKRVLKQRHAKGKFNGICKKCGIKIYRMHNEFEYCQSCYGSEILSADNKTQYEFGKGEGFHFLHQRIASVLTDRKYPMTPDDIIHHLDEDKNNNHPSNLVGLQRDTHSKLHIFLKNYKASYKGDRDWNEVRLEMTKRFFNTFKFKVVWFEKLFNQSSNDKKDFIQRLLTEKVKPGDGGIYEEKSNS